MPRPRERPPEATVGTCRLILGDCGRLLSSVGLVDLIVTSPPYNLGATPWEKFGNSEWDQGSGKWKNRAWRSSDGILYESHSDNMPWPEYVAWQRGIISQMWAVLSDAGAIFYVHKPRVIGGRLWTPLELLPPEVTLRQVIVWARPGGLNFTPVAFVPTCEWVLFLAKPAARLRSQAVSGLGDVWRIPLDQSDHPAPFPLRLVERIVEAFPARSILDPFMGSGTVGVAAQAAGVPFMGMEKCETYFKMARLRIERAADPRWQEKAAPERRSLA